MARKIPVKVKDLEHLTQINAVWARLPSPSAPPAGLFFASPAFDSWTGFVSHLDDGWCTLVNAMSKRSPKVEAILIGRDFEASIYPSTSFEVFRDGASVRSVRAWKEGNGWHFFDRGEALSFEDPANYRRRAIADRLNGEIIDDLLLKLGIDIDQLFRAPLSRAKLLTT